METIKMEYITKDYGNEKGVFDVSFTIKKGEIFGFLGPNGAGKTTTIRMLLGFIKKDKGSISLFDHDPYEPSLHHNIGYLPGETVLMDDMRGLEFLDFMCDIYEITDTKRREELLTRFPVDTTMKIKDMSKGMKQKIAIVCAFMHDPELYILDEPTSGLDPLMQQHFLSLLLEEKKRGKTIFMSSHIFEEVEKTCDRVAIIKDGRLVTIQDIQMLRSHQTKYQITFASLQQAQAYCKEHELTMVQVPYVLQDVKGSFSVFLQSLSQYEVTQLTLQTLRLEDLFMNYYGGK